jgi:hypothetical protein
VSALVGQPERHQPTHAVHRPGHQRDLAFEVHAFRRERPSVNDRKFTDCEPVITGPAGSTTALGKPLHHSGKYPTITAENPSGSFSYIKFEILERRN